MLLAKKKKKTYVECIILADRNTGRCVVCVAQRHPTTITHFQSNKKISWTQAKVQYHMWSRKWHNTYKTWANALFASSSNEKLKIGDLACPTWENMTQSGHYSSSLIQILVRKKQFNIFLSIMKNIYTIPFKSFTKIHKILAVKSPPKDFFVTALKSSLLWSLLNRKFTENDTYTARQ